jgi:TonB family protein
MIALAFVAAACSTRIASNLTSPAAEPPTPDKAASIVSTVDSSANVVATVDTGKPVAKAPVIAQQSSGQPYFDFQTENPATALPGVSPVYPADLRAAGVKGTELIQVVVRPDSMADMSTFKALKSDNPAFTAAVKEALAKMKFSPATVGGRTVSQLVQLPFVFGTVDSAVRATELPIVERGRVTAPSRPRNPDAPYFDFQVDRPAMALQGAAPRYPESLREQNIEGDVLAQFVVDANGVPDVSTFKVLRASDPAFGEAVRAALPDMRFSPAQLSDGTKVKQLVQQPFGFRVNR